MYKSLLFVDNDEKRKKYYSYVQKRINLTSKSTSITSYSQSNQTKASPLKQQMMKFSRSDQVQDNDDGFELYLKDSTLYSTEVGVLGWWKENQFRFPSLLPLALQYLTIQASSAASERVWSDMGGSITKKRNKLTPKTAGMLEFLKSNSDLW